MPEKLTPSQLRARAAADLAEADRLDSSKQYSADDLKSMTPHEIHQARVAGQLDTILKGEDA